jgi:hypothetical protein
MTAVALAAADQLRWSTISVLGRSVCGTTVLRVSIFAPERVARGQQSVGADTMHRRARSEEPRRPQPLDDGPGSLGVLPEELDYSRLLRPGGHLRTAYPLIVGESDPFVTAEYLRDTLAA